MGLRAELTVVTVDETFRFSPIHEYAYDEALGELWSLAVEFGSEDPDLDLSPLLRASAELRSDEEAVPLVVKGIVRSIEQLRSEPGGLSRYRIVLAPELWVLTQNRTRRIFQEQDVLTTTLAILNDAPASQTVHVVPAVLTEPHPPVSYRTQYDESDFAFLRRIWLEEGFVPAFGRAVAKGEGAERDEPAILLIDDTSLLPVELELPYEPLASGAHAARNGLRAIRLERGAVAVPERAGARDFDFTRPKFIPEGEATRRAGTARDDVEVFEFRVDEPPGNMNLRAARLLEAAQLPTGRAVLQTTATLLPGRALRITGHPGGDVEVVVARVETRVRERAADGSERMHRIEAMVRKLRFRLPPPKRPSAEGVQSAFVVGEGEIDVDEHGSVLVRFPWDRRPEAEQDPKRSSRRIRVAQTWAGAGYGLTTVPRVGEEVLISFLDGDPDNPVVMGRLFNGQSLSPVQLPAQKTQSSWRSKSSPGGELFNEILMEDLAGEEFLSITAGRDLFTWVGRDWESYVKRDHTIKVDGKSIVEVKQGTQTSVVGGSSKNIVGDSETTVTGDWTVTAGYVGLTSQDQLELDASNVFVEAGGLWVRTPSATQFKTGHFHVMASKISLQAAGASIVMEAGNIEITAPGNVTINGALVKLNCD